MIAYRSSPDGLEARQLVGFFDGWPVPPTPEVHLALLRGSEAVELAIDDRAGGRVVGFATAIGDGVLAASIPLLEVLPAWRGQGIGSELVRRLLRRLEERYMVDLVCDEELVPFYERLGLRRWTAMTIRRPDTIRAVAERVPTTGR